MRAPRPARVGRSLAAGAVGAGLIAATPGPTAGSPTSVDRAAAPARVADHAPAYGEHWDRNSPTATTYAQVYIEDHTGSLWRVNQYTNEWNNQSSKLGVYYLSDCNHKTLHCVPVYGGDYGDTGWHGLTSYSISGGHITHDSMTVQLNSHYLGTTRTDKHDSTTCHELGHAVAAFQDTTTVTTSCMWPDSSRFPLHPAAHDANVITALYNH